MSDLVRPAPGTWPARRLAGLTGAGVDAAIALSTVLVFRLITFWLPVPPAWLVLRHLRATDVI